MAVSRALSFDRLFLLDLDGTLYTGSRLHEGTAAFLNAVRAHGGRYVFLSNNSSRSTDDYIAKFAAMGIAADADDFYLSTHQAAAYLNRTLPGQAVYAMASASCISELLRSGINAVTDISASPQAVLIAYDTELTYKKLDDVCRLLALGLPYFATHPDMVCPTEYGFAPDCGAFADMIYAAVGRRPVTFGKPDAGMVRNVCEKFGYDVDAAVIVGDRLYTDIKCGLNAGCDTALLLSGETTPDMLAASDIKPGCVFADIGKMYAHIAG